MYPPTITVYPNLITPENVCAELATDKLITNDYIYSDRHRKYWSLRHAIKVKLSTGKMVVIPEDFKWDLSSSPKWAWGLVPPFGDFLFASLVHDYLYIYKQSTKDFADSEMLFWSNIVNDNKFDNKIRYWAVKLFGMRVWRMGKWHPIYNPNNIEKKKK